MRNSSCVLQQTRNDKFYQFGSSDRMNIDRRTTCVNHENYTPLIKCSHQQWTRRYGISIGYVSECVHLLLMQLSNITRIWCRWPLLAHRQSQRPPKRQHIPKIPSSMPVSLMHRTHTTHILIDHKQRWPHRRRLYFPLHSSTLRVHRPQTTPNRLLQTKLCE